MNLSLCPNALTDQPHGLEKVDQLFINLDYLSRGKTFFHKGSAQRIVKPDVQDFSATIKFIEPEHLLYYG